MSSTDCTLVICRPDSFPLRRIAVCPVENRRRRMAGFDQAWYGPTIICLGCGDSWTSGEMCPRPFKPRWRQEAIANGKRWWDRAAGLTRADHRAWLAGELAL